MTRLRGIIKFTTHPNSFSFHFLSPHYSSTSSSSSPSSSSLQHPFIYSSTPLSWGFPLSPSHLYFISVPQHKISRLHVRFRIQMHVLALSCVCVRHFLLLSVRRFTGTPWFMFLGVRLSYGSQRVNSGKRKQISLVWEKNKSMYLYVEGLLWLALRVIISCNHVFLSTRRLPN